VQSFVAYLAAGLSRKTVENVLLTLTRARKSSQFEDAKMPSAARKAGRY
jgi:hypothetical protein